MIFRRSKQVGGEINITPLVDMVFNLIIFLLLGTTFKTAERAFPIDLPKASNEQIVVSRDKPVVFVKKNGEIFFLNYEEGATPVPVTREELYKYFLSLKEKNPDVEVSIRGESEASLQTLIVVIDTAYQAGLTKIELPYEVEKK